jgi:hypothetical protein
MHTNGPTFGRVINTADGRSAGRSDIPVELLAHCSKQFGIEAADCERAYRVLVSGELNSEQVSTRDIARQLLNISMTLKTLEMLYQRACYESNWEISLGARCILANQFPSSNFN